MRAHTNSWHTFRRRQAVDNFRLPPWRTYKKETEFLKLFAIHLHVLVTTCRFPGIAFDGMTYVPVQIWVVPKLAAAVFIPPDNVDIRIYAYALTHKMWVVKSLNILSVNQNVQGSFIGIPGKTNVLAINCRTQRLLTTENRTDLSHGHISHGANVNNLR